MKGFRIVCALGLVAFAASVGCSSDSKSDGDGDGGGSGGAVGKGGSAGKGGSGGSSGSTGGSSGSGGTSGAGGSTAGTGGSAGAPGDAGQCVGMTTAACTMVDFGSPACTTCAQGPCCNAVAGCFGDPGCAGLNDCLDLNCNPAPAGQTTQQCAMRTCGQCLTMPIVDKFNAIVECIQMNCAAACGGGDAGPRDAGGGG